MKFYERPIFFGSDLTQYYSIKMPSRRLYRVCAGFDCGADFLIRKEWRLAR